MGVFIGETRTWLIVSNWDEILRPTIWRPQEQICQRSKELPGKFRVRSLDLRNANVTIDLSTASCQPRNIELLPAAPTLFQSEVRPGDSKKR
jgi:hypothetical protein